jgi:chromosome segregation ATPase
MRSQMSGGDVRAERLVKQVRGEVDELRTTLASLTAGPGDLSTLDYDAVAANPAAAALLPPATLVAAITELHGRNRKLARKSEKLEARLEALETKVRDLKQDRAWARGRLDTLAEVIEALHANIEDLRHHRDNTRALAAPAVAPRALRAAGQAGVNGHPADHPAIPSSAAEG